MSRRKHAHLLTLCLLWQALAALLPAAVNERAEHFRHALVHAQALEHHHGDTSLQLDADATLAHQHAPDGSQPFCLSAPWVAVEVTAPGSAIHTTNKPMPRSALLEGPSRPPPVHVA